MRPLVFLVAFGAILQGCVGVTCPTTRSFRVNSSAPVTMLYSFEGSGNTWMRFLLENSTGIYSGAIYSDPTLKKAGFLGESRTGNEVIAVKSHFDRTPPVIPAKGTLLYAKYKKFIHLTRHPMNAFVAERKRRLTGSHVGTPSPEVFLGGTRSRSKEFRDNPLPWSVWLQDYAVPTWAITVKHALNVQHNTKLDYLVVRYEDLKRDLNTTLGGVLSFLDQDPRLAECVQSTRGKALRTTVYEYPSCMYTREEAAIVRKGLCPYMKLLGYYDDFPGCPHYQGTFPDDC